MIKYRTVDTLNLVVILKPVRSLLLDDLTRIRRGEYVNARKHY